MTINNTDVAPTICIGRNYAHATLKPAGATEAQILDDVEKPTYWLTPCDYHLWASKWVRDSATQASEAYQGITFGAATIAADGRLDQVEIKLEKTTKVSTLHGPRSS